MARQVAELSVGYYVDNFRYVLDFVQARYSDILDPAEQAYGRDFAALTGDAQRLYVRLIQRKGPLFREDKLNYPEISSIEWAADTLLATAYLDQAADVTAAELIPLLTRQELLALASCQSGTERLAHAMKRPALEAAIRSTTNLADLRRALGQRLLRPLGQSCLQTYRLLFFGNLYQNFSEFVLHDLGIAPYEAYAIHPDDRYFNDRQRVDETLRLHRHGEAAGELIQAGDVEAMFSLAAGLPDQDDRRLRRRSGRICNRIARELERKGMEAPALTLYRRSGVAPCRERCARILAKWGDVESAIRCCRQMVDDPEDEAEYEFAVTFARRLQRRRGLGLDGFPVPSELPVSYRALILEAEPGQRVETLVQRWFEADGAEAHYVENGLFPGLFGLCFWDIIFHPVRGVFFNPFQRAPDDLFTPEFRVARAPLIEARLQAIQDPVLLQELLLTNLRAHHPRANHFVNWLLLSQPLVVRAVERIPNAHLIAVFRRLLRDLRHNCAGFPDLIIFPRDGGYLMVEVKGPGDALQANQRRWMRFFADHNMPAEVVNVTWQ